MASIHSSGTAQPTDASADAMEASVSSIGNMMPTHHTGDIEAEDPDLKYYAIPLLLKHKDKWEDKHTPTLHIRAKYMPYRALRQQFWRAMLRHYDADDTGRIDKVELTTTRP